MSKRFVLPVVATCALIALIVLRMPASSGVLEPARPLPPFHTSDPADWFNSPPLKVGDLRGRVVLIDFWTFDCWNCYRSFPWLKGLEQRLADKDFLVIGVHTPEFKHESIRANVAAKIAEFGLEHPVVVDNRLLYWRAMNNRYWPAFYLIDKAGQVRHLFIGETHDGDRQAKAIEAAIDDLLAE